MIKVLINGCNGKMGQELAKAIDKNDNFKTICGVDRVDTGDNKFPVYTDISKITEEPDVIIDFSIPVATFKILEYAVNKHIPIVICTTGFSEEETKKIEELSKQIPIFRSANMSYEINLMSSLVAQITINKELNNEMHYEYDRHSKREKRNKKEIGIHSIRGGNTVGTHTVTFFSENETFEITHTANSRGVFAEGALKAAEYLAVQDNGLYSMNDLIK